RGVAERMLALGHNVRVWNRTASRCAPLVALGATQADTPAAAVEGADHVHLVLTADAAVESVIEQLRPGLAEGVPLLDHSTNLPARVAERAPRLRAEGVHYLHAPVFMGPRNAREGTGLMLVSGPSDAIKTLTPYLETLTGAVRDLGERPDKAAAVKIIGNSVLLMMTATMGDAFTVGAATGVTPEEIIGLFQAFSPSPAGMGQRVLSSKDGPVGFEAVMARKDAGLMIAAAGEENLHLLPIIAAVLDEGIAAGRGQEDFTAMFRPT
ncbi:MAG: NAD(P)-binding domain-containing protein, partial [Myxococcota bacterium]